MDVPESPAVPSVECYDEYEVDQVPDGHCSLLPLQHLALYVCVARPVSKDEIKRQPQAQAALQLEWDRLRALRRWGEDCVVEWSTVAQQARKGAATCHVGRRFSLCHEKNSELAPDDPRRKFKGRVVFQGNRVRDQNWNIAVFQELSSCPLRRWRPRTPLIAMA